MTVPATRHPRRLALLGLLAGGLVAGAPLHAEPNDHDLARQALQQGKVLPLRTVLEQVERDYQGQVLEVELDRDDGMFIYEIKLLAPGGNLMKMKLDAATGKVLGIKQKGRH